MSVALRIDAKVGKTTAPALVVVAVAEISAVVGVGIILRRIDSLRTIVTDISDSISIEVRLILVENLYAVVLGVQNAISVGIICERE